MKSLHHQELGYNCGFGFERVCVNVPNSIPHLQTEQYGECCRATFREIGTLYLSRKYLILEIIEKTASTERDLDRAVTYYSTVLVLQTALKKHIVSQVYRCSNTASFFATTMVRQNSPVNQWYRWKTSVGQMILFEFLAPWGETDFISWRVECGQLRTWEKNLNLHS